MAINRILPKLELVAQVDTGIPTVGLEGERVTEIPEAQDSSPPTLLENEVDRDVEGSRY